MRLLILLLAIALPRLSECSVPYQGVTVGITPYSRPVVSQYHRQDNYGHYVYGYATDLSSQDEVKTPDGVTRGGYSYIDANGILQTVQYISDPVNGFRVLATNIPRDLPEVAHARAQHLAQFEHIKAEHAALAATKQYQPILSPVSTRGSYIVPVRTQVSAPTPVSFQPIVVADPALEHIQVTPVAAVVPVQHAIAYTPVVAVSSQYHAQDNLGQYSYGYADPNSAKSETKTADGVTRGGYSYIDANGILQTVHYVSDPVNGFRVTGTNLPEAPSVTLIGPKVTTTVVGPKDNNAVVATAPVADTVIAPAVNIVPGYSTAHIDSIGIEQRPVLTQTDIVPNANVPIASPAGPYIHPNPNHETPVVYTNPELTAPFQSSYPSPHINSQVYGAAPIPITHSQAALHNKDPVYNIPPVLENNQNSYNPELTHHRDQSAIPILHHNQDYNSQNQQEQIYLNHAGHEPTNLGSHHKQAYIQANQPPQILLAPDVHSQTHHNHANQQIILSDAQNQPHQQVLVSHENGHFSDLNNQNHQIYITPDGHVSVKGNEQQQILATPAGHQNQQVLLAPGDHQGQIYADPNHAHTGHSIQLTPELTSPSHDERTNYYPPEYAVPINAEAINNGPTNQQVLNHEGAHSQLAFQPRDSAAYGNSAAYDRAYTYGENPAYGKQISSEGRPLFLPDGSAAAGEVQQVYQHQAPVGHGPQVATGHEQQQDFAVTGREHEQERLQQGIHEGQHATSPSGYYTQNIQY